MPGSPAWKAAHGLAGAPGSFAGDVPVHPLEAPLTATTGHRKDWWAPPSWSNTKNSDPFPSRKEKLRRKLRMTSYQFRRLQHQQQCKVYWE